ncbi:MAG: hypothetical protein E6K80_01120 [Candidatus Eisenbacteria bacterium]|uniref:4-alpha-L-fucosyltransferase n=1 Tax=Eiseniibacteriota bacterium TaxID=2212470 RepID=A0A538UAY1_UNCEI|nr:MAG: hypothetical protein E6K80_01120 [Candidatus Eisenbacteria bacterium]
MDAADRWPAEGDRGVIHHVIASSPYTTRFVKLLGDHPESFPPQEHRFWIESGSHGAFRVGHAGPFAHVEVGPWGFVQAFRRRAAKDHVVIHQLSNPRLLLYLAGARSTTRRCAWSVWGGDVYYYRQRPRTWDHPFRESLRRAVIPSIPVISSMIPGDYETVRSIYGSCARYVHAFYPIPMDYASLELDGDRPPRNGATILVGNSGHPSNAHAEVFRILARLRDPTVQIVSPLSYGHRRYVSSVIALGRELFGERFQPLTEFLPAAQYARLIRGTDAAIMNHDHQQALGNIIAMLMMGKKVFVRRPATGACNAAAVRAHLSEENAVAGWRNLFTALNGAV